MQQHRRLRVLCLHSFRTSAKIFQQQFARAGLDLALEDLIDMTFIDATQTATGPPPPDVRFEGPYYEWCTIERVPENEGSKDADAQPEANGWQGTSNAQYRYNAIEKSEAFITDYMERHGPFDGLLGFSQGSIMGAGLVAMQRAGTALTNVPQLRFFVAFGAADTKHPPHLEAMVERVQVPSCHIIGHNDYIKQSSIDLVRKFESPIVVVHPRGHVIPRLQGPQLAVLRAFLTSFMQQPQQSKL